MLRRFKPAVVSAFAGSFAVALVARTAAPFLSDRRVFASRQHARGNRLRYRKPLWPRAGSDRDRCFRTNDADYPAPGFTPTAPPWSARLTPGRAPRGQSSGERNENENFSRYDDSMADAGIARLRAGADLEAGAEALSSARIPSAHRSRTADGCHCSKAQVPHSFVIITSRMSRVRRGNRESVWNAYIGLSCFKTGARLCSPDKERSAPYNRMACKLRKDRRGSRKPHTQGDAL